MTDMITAALRQRAEGDVHVERLLGAVHAGARRRRQRRTVLASGVTMLALLLVAVAGAAPPWRSAPGSGVAAAPHPPAVLGLPTAARVPAVLGSDKTLFHLDVVGLTGWDSIFWGSRTGYEDLVVSFPGGGEVTLEVSRTALPIVSGPTWKTTVNGRPADAVSVADSYSIGWQPEPGLYARAVATHDIQAAIDAASGLRLDRVYRCAVPFRLSGLAGVRMNKCTTGYYTDNDTGVVTPGGGVWFTPGATTLEYEVIVGNNSPTTAVNDTIAGRAVQAMHVPAATQEEIRYPYDGRTAYFWLYGGPVDPEYFRSLVQRFTPVPGDDPLTWPRNPLS